MVQYVSENGAFPATSRKTSLFAPPERPAVAYPITSVEIDWERPIAKRPLVLDTVEAISHGPYKGYLVI